MKPVLVTVSNGKHCIQIDPADLDKAREDGFTQPFERGATIVGNDRWMFEIPIAELESVTAAGLHEVGSPERLSLSRPKRLVAGRSREVDSGRAASTIADSEDSIARDDASDSVNAMSDASVLLTELSQVEREAEEKRVSQEKELAETTGWRWYWMAGRMWIDERRSMLDRQLRSGGISAALHVAILLFLASLFMKVDEEPKGLLLSAMPTEERAIEEVIIQPTPLEITEPSDRNESDAPAEVEIAKNQAVEAPDFMAAVRGDAIEPPASPAAAGDKGESMPLKEASFFGRKVAAVNYVFVIDNSNSMTGGRFETALNELLIAVNQLTARQRFYVIFYSDTAYPMFHPKPASQLIPATPRNKEMLRYWLGTVQLCLQTNGKEAIAAGFQLQPDVMFVLGDGAFTDGAARFFASQPQNRIPVHTLGMEVKPKDADDFRRLAEANGGTYKDVGVSPQAKAIAKANPRPRNSVRGPIWGLKLKPQSTPK